MPNESQIFQTNHPGRWQRFKWGGRLFLFLLVFAAVILGVTVHNISKDNPSIPLEGKAIKKVLTSEIPAYRESNLGKQYRGMRKYIETQWAKGKGTGQKPIPLDLSTSPFFSDSLGIRAAFYVAWDPQSYTSLLKNISKINLVLPEWFFIDPTADTLVNTIDQYALTLIRKSNVKVMPLLSNNYRSKFNGAALHRILHSQAKTDRLIDDVIKLLKDYDFAGINVDFEEMKEEKNESLTNFQKELYTRLHAAGLMVTQNVSPFNEDYDYKQLSKYNDYVFLMAYDQHSESTKPGPICSQKWIESAVNKLATQVPANKIVLNLAAFGYDWSKTKKRTARPISYQQALAFAKESDAVIDFDNDTYNLHYLYYDDNNVEHEVHFIDAATNFNTLRFATEYGLAGTALWRLGDEDSRLWEFYNQPMTKTALKTFNFSEFANVKGGFEPDFFGEGEILDIIASPTDGHITPEIDSVSVLISEEHYDKLPSTYVIKRWGKTSEKKLVLTYDDGPDPVYTRQILDTLAFYHVPASFFLVGIEAENNIPLVKRIYNEGYEIGNHTFTHPNIAQVSKNRALLEMDATRLLIECITRHSTILFRPPYNADSEPGKFEELVPIELSRTRNYITIGESIDPEDWQQSERKDINADTIFNRVVDIYNAHLLNEDSANIILLHDAGGNRTATVNATGKIIRYFQAKGYKFTTIADLLGKKRDDLMPLIPVGSGYRLLQFNAFLFEVGYLVGHFINALFIVFLSISALRLFILGIFAFLQKKKEKHFIQQEPIHFPLVSIIVPAYNEEVNAVSSLENLLHCNYPLFDIIFVDDGSKDDTYKKVKAAYGNHPQVKIFTKPNGGKSSALNFGIEQTSANYLVCIDADTKLSYNAVAELMTCFAHENVGAAAGIVKVGNQINMLTKWQSIEYISSQNFDRKGFAYLNAITVVPGAIGAFKKEVLIAAGGFTTDTLAEDCDLSIRILKAGYTIMNQPKAIAYTEAPETIHQFMKQRFRWSFGIMQTFWKHKELLFNSKYKALGWVALPDILLFKYLIPLFSPLADFFMLMGLFSENRYKIGIYYGIFLVVDALIAAIAFAFDHEKPWKLIWLIPQRLIYRWLMLVVLFRSFRRALKGELQIWGVLKRTGNVKEIVATTEQEQ